MSVKRINCLFCRSGDVRQASYPRPTVFNNKIFYYKYCRHCGLVFIDPLPSADDYKKMYDRSYHDQFYFKNSLPDYSKWFTLFERFSKGKNIVDYGCGDGSFLRFFKQRGYEGIGVEYDPELVARLRKENPEILFYTVDEFWNFNPRSEFDVIFMGDVLEHVSTPADFLIKLLTKVKEGGLIAAQGPLENNINLALGFRKFISKSKTIIAKSSLASHVPYHISFSNAKNQRGIFAQAGLNTRYFKVFETTWPFPEKFSSSPAPGFKYLVARISIFLSKILPGNMGNRFLYIGEKN